MGWWRTGKRRAHLIGCEGLVVKGGNLKDARAERENVRGRSEREGGKGGRKGKGGKEVGTGFCR